MGDEQEEREIKVEAGCTFCPYCNGNLVIEDGLSRGKKLWRYKYPGRVSRYSYKIGSYRIVCENCNVVWVDEEGIE